eukprot:751711-Alexandrium_andersonii.AAC.1
MARRRARATTCRNKSGTIYDTFKQPSCAPKRRGVAEARKTANEMFGGAQRANLARCWPEA